MRALRLAVAVVAATSLTLACSSSTSPKPTFAGTWHVTVGPLDSGTISPSSFNVTVAQVSADSFTATMPALTWSVGSMVFDSASEWANMSDTAFLGFDEHHRSPTRSCQFVLVFGRGNAARDSLESAELEIGDTTTYLGQPACKAGHTASATVVKQ